MLQKEAFQFDVPVNFFEKAGAPKGREKRIGGIVSTEAEDRQGEVILQRGLDFDPFLQHGWYNDNHSKKTTDIVGYPETVQFFQKGDELPDGTKAKAKGHWAEGYLLDTEKGREIWDTGRALQKSGRRLGFSVEGNIEKRTGPGRKTIAKATVKNVAITNAPVNAGTRLETLAKSLYAAEQDQGLFPVNKALGMGTSGPGFTPGVTPSGPQTGATAGQVLTPQSLEGKEHYGNDKKKRKKKRKKLTKSEAIQKVWKRFPNASPSTVARIVHAATAMKRNGQL